MENANKFKVVRDITVLDCSTPYMFEKTKKRIADKYKGLGIADDAMLAKLWKNVEVDYSQFMYPTVVDFELTKYDTETVNAAFKEIGVLYGEITDNNGELSYGINFYNKVDQLPVFIGDNNNSTGYYSLEIFAHNNSVNRTTLYTSIGWADSRKDKEVAVETLQKGKPFFWSFVNWVKVYIGQSLKGLNEFVREIAEGVGKGIFDGHLEVRTDSVKTVIERASDKGGSVLKFQFVDNNKVSAYFLTYDKRGEPTLKGSRLVFDPQASPYTGKDQSGVQIIGADVSDILMARGGYKTFEYLFNLYAPAATTEKKGAVKKAGKVDALADGATLAQAVERLNTLIAQLKSAGIMSEN